MLEFVQLFSEEARTTILSHIKKKKGGHVRKYFI